MIATNQLDFKQLASSVLENKAQLDELVIIVYDHPSGAIPIKGVSGTKYRIGGRYNPILVSQIDAQEFLTKAAGAGRRGSMFRTLTTSETQALNKAIAEVKAELKDAPKEDLNALEKAVLEAATVNHNLSSAQTDEANDNIDTDLVELKGVGQATAEIFYERGIQSIADLAELSESDLETVLEGAVLPKNLNLSTILAQAKTLARVE